MTLDNIIRIFSEHECPKIYTKVLSANDNSKNQVYLGGSFDILNIFPFSEVTSDESGDWKKTRFKATLSFSWLTDHGVAVPAPHAQLILYPKYPEVRFSGFLRGCANAPNDLMTVRLAGRILFLGISKRGQILGFVVSPTSEAARQFNNQDWDEENGVFKIIPLRFNAAEGRSRELLLEELHRIHDLGWIDSKRLDKYHVTLPCNSPNCGGYTLEAELGITPNGYSEPDYLGWEVKQFGVKSFDKLESSRITLMTPEPTGGLYKSEGVDAFLYKYGYPDKRGRPDRLNFGGVHKVGERKELTGLTMILPGFDSDSGKIRNTSGSISLVSDSGDVAASWSFSGLLEPRIVITK